MSRAMEILHDELQSALAHDNTELVSEINNLIKSREILEEIFGAALGVYIPKKLKKPRSLM